MTPSSYVLVHSPLTGPVVWGRLPWLLEEQGCQVVMINVQDDHEPPYAERYVRRASAQVSAARPASPVIFVAHSGAGPLLPALAASLHQPNASPAGYIFLDAVLPSSGQPSRLDLLREEDPSFAAAFEESLNAGGQFPAWTTDDLADIVPRLEERVALIESLRSRRHDFFAEPLPRPGEWPDGPCGYLRTSAAYDFWLRIAAERGWPVTRRDLGHFPALASPEATLEALVELTARL